MYLHLICTNPNSVYIRAFVEFISKNFNVNEHLFLTSSPTNNYQTEEFRKLGIRISNIKFSSSIDVEYLSMLAKDSDKILIHSMFATDWLSWLYNKQEILKKSIWVAWGGDIYNFWLKGRKYHSFELLIEYFKTEIIKNIHGIACLVQEDYNFVKEMYITNAIYYYVFYPNPVNFYTLDEATSKIGTKQNNGRRMLLGNSATWTNNHMEVQKALAEFLDEDYEIICPLSYGDLQYANQVIQFGKRLFGERFIPLTDYMKPEDYAVLLSTVDVGVFNHNRQQGLGNILALLYLMKKVYIRSDVTTWAFLNRLGIKVFDTKEILNGSVTNLFDFDKDIGLENREIVSKEFSEQKAVEVWQKLLE